MEPATEQVIPLEQFVEKFRRLCGHIAWNFVRQSWNNGEIALTKEDAEDFASEALIRLTKCPERHRGNKFYVQLLIQNAIITAWRKRLRQGQMELDKSVLSGVVGQKETKQEIFDLLPGRDGLAPTTQAKFDSQKAMAALGCLTDPQRIVLELSFGLNGCTACTPQVIAKKLGRMEWWVSKTYRAAIYKIQQKLEISTVL